jgi:formate dehydrogenase maturation protein FdhE
MDHYDYPANRAQAYQEMISRLHRIARARTDTQEANLIWAVVDSLQAVHTMVQDIAKARTEADATRRCPACGAELATRVVFCKTCGWARWK